MSSPLVKWLIAIAVWLVFALVTLKGCIEPVCCNAGKDTTEAVAPAEPVYERFPVDSQLGLADVNTTDDFADWAKNLAAGLADGQVLEVEGVYYESESVPEGSEFANMGLLRANKVIDLLADGGYIPREKMRPAARLLDDDTNVKEGYFLTANPRWVADDANTDVGTTTVETYSYDGAEITTIFFPRGSNNEITEAEVLAAIDNIARHLKENPDDRIEITGHASKEGDADGFLLLPIFLS